MYLAVLATITGQALLLSRPVLLGYATMVGAAFITFVYGVRTALPGPAVRRPVPGLQAGRARMVAPPATRPQDTPPLTWRPTHSAASLAAALDATRTRVSRIKPGSQPRPDGKPRRCPLQDGRQTQPSSGLRLASGPAWQPPHAAFIDWPPPPACHPDRMPSRAGLARPQRTDPPPPRARHGGMEPAVRAALGSTGTCAASFARCRPSRPAALGRPALMSSSSPATSLSTSPPDCSPARPPSGHGITTGAPVRTRAGRAVRAAAPRAAVVGAGRPAPGERRPPVDARGRPRGPGRAPGRLHHLRGCPAAGAWTPGSGSVGRDLGACASPGYRPELR